MINVYLFFMKTKTVIGGKTGQILSYLLGANLVKKQNGMASLLNFCKLTRKRPPMRWSFLRFCRIVELNYFAPMGNVKVLSPCT